MEWWQWLLIVAGLAIVGFALLLGWTFYMLVPRSTYNEDEERLLAEEYLAQTRNSQ